MNERAGTLATPADLVDLEALNKAYYTQLPDASDPAQRVAFGTSGHRGSALTASFNEAHIAAVCVAVAEYRAAQGWGGPLFLGADTHPLSEPAFSTAEQILLSWGVNVRPSFEIDGQMEYVPTPALSHTIINYNRDKTAPGDLADGIIITPSHNPPQDGGIKYNPPHGGPADSDATKIIEARANELLPVFAQDLPLADRAEKARGGDLDYTSTSTAHHFQDEYVAELAQVIDMAAIRAAGIKFAAHPLGGAAVEYWHKIAADYELDLTVLGPGIDKQWSFMSLDWDGKIRMDPSSQYAMQAVCTAAKQEGFALVVANDADADRHGIVCNGELMNPNHFLAVAIDYLLTHRKAWGATTQLSIGKTIVSSGIIDRVVAAHGANLYEVPVGFKWFVTGLDSGTLVFGGEESAGASLLTRDGKAWSTDKDGIALSLLAAEIYAVTGKLPSDYYAELTARFGAPAYQRIDAAATPEQKAKLLALTAQDVTVSEFAGETITEVLTHAPGNGAAIGGLVIRTENAWAAIRPSGTEAVMKVYAESFLGQEHLQQVQDVASELLAQLLG